MGLCRIGGHSRSPTGRVTFEGTGVGQLKISGTIQSWLAVAMRSLLSYFGHSFDLQHNLCDFLSV